MNAEHKSAGGPDSQVTTRKRRKWPVIVGGILVVLALLVLLAPTLISSMGKGAVVAQVNGLIKGSVKIDSLSLSWFGGQKITGLELIDPEGKTVATLDGVSTDLSLLSAVRGNLDLGQVAITGLQADLVVDDENRVNLLRAVEMVNPSPPSDEPAKVPPTLAMDARLTDAVVTLTAPGIEKVELNKLTLAAKLPSIAEPLSFELAARSRQGDLSGDLAASGNASKLFAADGTVTADQVEADVKLDATGLPVEGVDRLIGMQGKLAAALGARVDLHVTSSATARQQQFALNVDAPRAQVKLAAKASDGTLTLAEPGLVKFTMTDALMRKLTADWNLGADVPTQLQIEKLSVPMGAFDPSKVALRASFKAEAPMQLTGAESTGIGKVSVSNLSASVDTEKLSQAINISLTADTNHNNQPGKVAVAGELASVFDEAGKMQLDKLNVDASAKIQGVPTALVDRVPGNAGLLAEALGDVINLDATAKSTGANRIDAQLSINSPRLVARDMHLAVAETISVKDAVIELTLTPALAGRFLKGDEAMKLTLPTRVIVNVKSLNAPRPKEGEPAFVPSRTSIAAAVTSDKVLLTNVPQLGALALDKLAVNAAGDSLAAMRVDVSALASQFEPQIATTATQPEPGLIAELAGQPQMSVGAIAKVGLNDDNSLKPVEAILTAGGKSLDVQLGARMPADFASLEMPEPGHIKLTATPALLKHLNIALPDNLAPTGPTPVTLNITQLRTPLKDFAADKVRAVVDLKVAAASANDPLAILLGPSVGVSASVTPADAGGSQVIADIAAEHLKASIQAAIDADQMLTLTKPATIDRTITPQMLRLLNVIPEGKPTLAENAHVVAQIQTLRLPLKDFALSKAAVAMTAAIESLRLAGDQRLAGAKLTDTDLTVTFDGSAATADMTLEGAAAIEGQEQPAPLNARAKITQLLGADGAVNLDAANVDASVHFQGLPTSFVETIAAQSGKLVPVVGPTLSAVAEVKLAGGLKKPTGSVTLKADSPQLAADAALTLAESMTLARPATLRMTLTPAGYAALRGPEAPLKLVDPATVNATINTFSYPLNLPEATTFDPARIGLDAKLTITKLTIAHAGTDRAATLENFTASAVAPSLAQPIAVQVNADLARPSPTAAPTAGRLAVSANVADTFKPDGSINTDTLSAKVDARLVALPGDLAEALFGSGDGKLAALLGDAANASFTADVNKMQGPVVLTLDGANVKANVPGMLADGVMTLTENATASLTITEQLSKAFLNHPLLKQAVRSEEPAELVIYRENFRFPVRDYALSKINIDRATLDPRRIVVNNGGLIKTLVELPAGIGGAVKGDLSGLIGNQTLNAWFTPLTFSLKDGVMTYSRMDMLLGDNYQVATWGTLNLSDEPITLGKRTIPAQNGYMVLGIAERAMRRVYGITAFQDQPDYVDQFLMVGPLDAIGPDKKDLTARLTLLTSAGTAAQVGGDDVADAVNLGIKILGQVGSKIRKQEFEPAPPAPKPYPWPVEQKPETVPAQQPNSATQQPATTKPAKPKSVEEQLLDSFLKKKR